MNCRKATHDDAEAIARLHAESWRFAYRGAYRDEYLDGDVVEERMAVWDERLSQPAPDQFVIVAEDGGEIVGFACAYGRDDERWGTLLDNIHVLPGRYERGIGARLVAEVATWCRSNYADCGLYLWVLVQNTRARRFYERLGATDRGGEFFVPPGGGRISSRRYAWATAQEIGRVADG